MQTDADRTGASEAGEAGRQAGAEPGGAATAEGLIAGGAFWVFGYGSLIWDPGFAVAEQAVARLDGWARSFCMRSIHHRGSVEAPGLVLALDARAGASCEGLAFRIDPGAATAALAGLRARELVSSAYLERVVTVDLRDGRRLRALAYVIDPAHAQYCGGLDLATQADIIARATGGRGANRDYLFNTHHHLRALGLHDAGLDELVARVAAL